MSMNSSIMNRYRYFVNIVKRNYRVLVIIVFIIGIIFAEEVEVRYLFEIILILLLFSFFVSFKLGIIMFTLILGQLRSNFANQVNPSHIANYLNDQLEITASVISYPTIKDHDQILILKPHEIKHDKQIQKVRFGYIQLKTSKYLKLEKGERVKFVARIQEPENFDEFDYISHLKSQNIYGLVDQPQKLVVTQERSMFNRKVGNFRKFIVTEINQSFPDPHAKLLAGMLIGTREQFSPKFANNLSITGTSHVVAVSGYNISLLSSSILRLSGYIHRKRLIIVSFIGLIFFLLIVGLDNVPAFRAGLMGFITLFSMLYGRKGAGVFILFLVAGIMHLQNPFIYNSLSFQLSFSATLGLMMLSNNLKLLLERFVKGKIDLSELSTTLSALLVTFPVTFPNFGKLTLYAILTNVFIAPLIVYITFLGLIHIVVNTLGGLPGVVTKAFLWGLLETMIRIIDVFATLPYADLAFTENTKLAGVIVGLVIVYITFELHFREYYKKHVK